MAYFPFFVNLNNKKCLVVGGGQTAIRKANTLLSFGASVIAVAEMFSGTVDALMKEKAFEESDLDGIFLAVAATDDMNLNRQIAEMCRSRRIPVNCVDQTDYCDFIFPAYRKCGDAVAAFSGGGKSPVLAQYMAEKSDLFMNDFLGDINDLLGRLRKDAAHDISDLKKRKAFYREVIEDCLENEKLPEESNLLEMMKKYRD